MVNLLNEYTPEEVEATGNQMYGGKRHDLICDELEKSGYKEEEINLISVGIWKGIESERRVQEARFNKLKEFWKPVLEKFEGNKFSESKNKLALDALTSAFDIHTENEELKKQLLSLTNKNKALQQEVEWLYDLEAAGVDNWSGIDEAYRLKRERLGETDEE